MISSAKDIRAASRRILKAAKYGIVTTRAGADLSARMVQHLEVSNDLEITFSTGRHTRKAAQIRQDPSLLIYSASDPATGAAVSLYGPAIFIEDKQRCKDAWIPELDPFFPDGPEGEEFILVLVQTQRIEVWSAGDQIHPAPFGLSSAKLTRSGDGWLEPGATHP